MNASVWTTVVAVLGALGGALLTTVLKNRSDRQQRRDERRWANQDTAVSALGDVLEALSNHYAAMWGLEAARLRGDRDEIATTLAASLVTRAAMTRPHLLAKLRVPSLADAIDLAVRAIYEMDSATDDTRTEHMLTERRRRAKLAMDALTADATKTLQQAGVGIPTPA
ncbi:hypothetical protein [Saccharothrix sp. HUAS TT1]|uniref:hypothetical protein n=1 Tax=unclassified Saccharothrix TaxID=2593673 RepID=UPI00345C5305